MTIALDPSPTADLYLNLLQRCLTRDIWPDVRQPWVGHMKGSAFRRSIKRAMRSILRGRGIELYQPSKYNIHDRENGRDWPVEAETMVGLKRTSNIRMCIEDVVARGVPGDLIETGVWRGGSCIFMRGVLKAYGVTDRTVWVADSFEGLPAPDPKYPMDGATPWHEFTNLRVSLPEVRGNFERYGLMDDQVRFLKGWFKDTLATAPIEQLAVLRLDGDMHESTMDAMVPLYPKLSVGGYVIVDDYGLDDPGCRAAIDDYRKTHDIKDPIVDIDGLGAYWKRSR